METNGSGPEHVDDGGAGVGVMGAPWQAIPGGNQPPLQHVPPPIEANGLVPLHVPDEGAGAGAGAGVGVTVGVPGQAIPGGSHPPLQQVPPPSPANGSDVVHEPDGGGGVGVGAGAGALALVETIWFRASRKPRE